jgi:hypothetical protein
MTVAARSKAWAVFAPSYSGIVGSNPTQGMDVCIVYIYSVSCVVLCVGSGLATGWSPFQGVLHIAYMSKKQKRKTAKAHRRALEP